MLHTTCCLEQYNKIFCLEHSENLPLLQGIYPAYDACTIMTWKPSWLAVGLLQYSKVCVQVILVLLNNGFKVLCGASDVFIVCGYNCSFVLLFIVVNLLLCPKQKLNLISGDSYVVKSI